MKVKDNTIKYPSDKTITSNCKDGNEFFKFEEDGKFKLTVEAVACCPGISGGITIQHPNDRVEPNPAGPMEQHHLDKGEDYSSTFEAKKGQNVHIFCNDIKRSVECRFKYTIKKV